MEITEVLRHGIVTEKSVDLQKQNKYTFRVALEANKIDIRRAVEAMFNVNVVSVNTMRMPGKGRMMYRRRRGSAPRLKEAPRVEEGGCHPARRADNRRIEGVRC